MLNSAKRISNGDFTKPQTETIATWKNYNFGKERADYGHSSIPTELVRLHFDNI